MSLAYFSHAEHCTDSETEPMPCCEDVEEILRVEEVSTSSMDFDVSPQLFFYYEIEFQIQDNLNPEFSTYSISLNYDSPPEDAIVQFQNFRI